MTTLTGTAAAQRGTLPRKAAFALLSTILIALLASSIAPTPLYADYQALWGFSDATVTVIFGVYAVAVLASLLVFGSLSDHVGRRPVLISALVIQSLVMVLFAFSGSVDALLLARVLQGLATGSALGAIGAGLVDLHQRHGAVANAASAMTGTASGGLVAALFIHFLPDPTRLIYLVMGVIFLAQAVLVTRITETSSRRPGARAALKPTLAVPASARGALIVAAPSLVAVWALAGFYGSFGPALAALVSGSNAVILAGATVFVLAGSGALAVLLFHDAPARAFALAGNILTITGVGIILWSISVRSIELFFAGTVVAGAGFGAGFQGGLRTIVPLVAPAERAGVLSVAYLISYLAMGLPAIGAGLLVVHSTLAHTADEYGLMVIALATLTATGLTRSVLRDRGQSSATACARGQVCIDASHSA